MDWTAVHTPTIVVLSSSEVETISAKNGLAFHEMLSAFSNCQLKTHFRSISSHYPLNQLKVRFIRACELRPRPVAVAEDLMKASVYPKPNEHFQVNTAYDAQSAKWYERYRTILQESLLCGEESMTECPAVMMVAISTSDVDPLGCFEQLDSSHYMPTSIQSGQFDPSISRYYLLVHDVSSNTSVDPEMLHRQLKQKFRNIHTQVLYVNSLPELNPTAPDVWAETISPVFFPADSQPCASTTNVRGAYLSAEDMLALRDLVHQVVIKEVVPAMEKRIAALNVTVTSSRKGVKNVIKSWWRKPREADDRSTQGVQYRYDQIENQILTLADAAFVMKDYDTSLSMFRLVKDDFKADKALIHQGSCHIMIAICLVLLDSDSKSTKRESETSLREAYLLFQTAQQSLGNRRKEVTLATRLATHASFLLADLLSSTGRNKEAADVLVRASRDESYLSSAILLEQAAWCFKLHTLDRKFAFHIILAGIKFHSSNLEQHAVRCFSAAKYLYEGTNWVHIQDYIQAHLAKHLTSEGDVEGALRCYLSIVGVGRQSNERQARYVRDFMETFTNHPNKLPQGPNGCEVLVPKIMEKKLKIYSCQNAGVELYNPKEISKSEADMWQKLCAYIEGEQIAHLKNKDGLLSNLIEECSLKAIETDENMTRQEEREQIIDYYGIKSIKVLHSMNQQKSGIIDGRVVGEPIVVGITMVNPLDIVVNIDNIQLVPLLTMVRKGEDGEDEDGQVSKVKLLNGPLFDEESSRFRDASVPLNESDDVMMIDSLNLVLQPRQQTEIFLRICPFRAGQLNIEGLRWQLNGKVWSLHKLALSGHLLQDSLEHRAQAARATNHTLTFDIHDTLPWLSFEVEELPDTILQGQVVQCHFKIRNLGRVASSNMVLKSNSPWLYIGKEPSIETDYEKQGQSPSENLIGGSGTLMKFGDCLEAGASLSLPVWFRGVGGGKQVTQLVLQYSSEDNKAIRIVRQSFEVCVLPSLHVFASVSPHPTSSAAEFILSVALTNFRASAEECSDLTIRKISCVSKAWSCEPILDAESIANNKHTLASQSSIVQFFKLRYQPPSLFHDSNKDSVIMDVCSLSNQFDHSNMQACAAYMCLDDMANQFVKQKEVHRLARVAQGNEGAPRSVSSVRRERAAGQISNGLMTEIPNYHPGSIKAFCNRYPNDVAVMVSWGSDDFDEKDMVGYHHLPGLTVCPKLDPNRMNGCPLALEISIESIITHKFQNTSDNDDDSEYESMGCVVPVKVRLTNQQFVGSPRIGFVFEVAQDSTELWSDSISWLGCLNQTVNSLEANEAVEFEIQACFPSPGVYELNQFAVRMSNNGTLFSFPTQSLVTVLNQN